MTSLGEDLQDVHPARQRASIGLALTVAVPGLAARLSDADLAHPVEALLFGLAIVGAAFLLSWAAEAAQLDISAGLAIALLALVAVLPEYAVDLVFASKAGRAVQQFGAACGPSGTPLDERPCSLALANMTGANRLLIGIGWPLVVLLAWWRVRSLKRPERAPRRGRDAVAGGGLDARDGRGLTLGRTHAVEVAFLSLATLYSLTLPLKHSISLWDCAVLVVIFAAYTVRIARAPAERPHLVGPARYVGTLGVAGRRVAVIAMFVAAGGIILLCAERFADALVETGRDVGVSSFVLVQWLAPLASEAPELLVAGLYAWRLDTDAGLGTLVSSKVNQWTLLVGTLPLVFAISSASSHGLPIGTLQREELFLTAAQSFLAVAVLVTLSLTSREALWLFGLFWSQFVLGAIVPESIHWLDRVGVGVVYLLMGVAVLVRDREHLRRMLRDGFRTPYSVLAGGGPHR